jgi:hypothetical protein
MKKSGLFFNEANVVLFFGAGLKVLHYPPTPN